jgi:hypothetical protein
LVTPTGWSCPRGVQQKLVCHFLTFLQVSTNFGSLHYFLGIKTNGKTFKTPGTVLGQKPARGLQLHWASNLLRQPRPGWRPDNRTHGRAGASTGVRSPRPRPAHRWARCTSVCGMSTPGVKATRRATRGSGRLTVTVARHEDGGGGPARWRCSEEWRATSMCHVSRGRIGGEEGHN